MRMGNFNWARRGAGALVGAVTLLAVQVRALDVIDPTGFNYSGATDNSHYNDSYVSANLFDHDVTGLALGGAVSGNEYARSGTGDCYVSFQLDIAYTNIASVFYAQRNGFSADLDKIGVISVWTSADTPFAAEDPGTAPASVVLVTNSNGAQWTEYPLTNVISGQYFLVKLEQTAVGGNPGGSELRFGAALGLAPTIQAAPADKTVYTNGTVHFTVAADGTKPLVYTWKHSSTVLTNDARISGADTAQLVISGVLAADTGSYSVTVSNNYGSTNLTATLAITATPTNAVEAAVIALQPRAFWQLNETVGDLVAHDFLGSYDGAYGSFSGQAVAGPQSPDYPGFAAANTALQTYASTVDSAVTVPALNVSKTNSVTLLAWIYQDGEQGPQQPYTGIVYCRGGGGQTSAGLIFSGDGTKLAYQWGGNRYDFDTGITIPTNQWVLVALVYTTNATTLYCGTTNGVVLSAVDNYTQGGQAFEAPMKIGLDTDVGESARTFNGSIDDVAFFDRALSSSDINAIYAAGTGIIPTVNILSQTATNLFVFQTLPINMSVQVSGVAPQFQWYKGTAAIDGANANTYVIPHAVAGDSGNYFVVVSNNINAVTSAVFQVTVPDYLLQAINPAGNLYTDISASSEYPDPNYVGTNMFDSDLTGVALGAHLTGKDWADDGPGTSYAPAYLTFSLDQSYQVDALLYAQRNNRPGEAIDKITSLSIWASTTTPFAAADPGTSPDATVAVPDMDAGVLHPYALPASVTGRYFLIQVSQDPVVNSSNFGGNEFRLARYAVSQVLTFSNSPSGLILTWPDSATLQQADSINGPWTTATGVTSGVAIPTTAAQRFYRIQY